MLPTEMLKLVAAQSTHSGAVAEASHVAACPQRSSSLVDDAALRFFHSRNW